MRSFSKVFLVFFVVSLFGIKDVFCSEDEVYAAAVERAFNKDDAWVLRFRPQHLDLIRDARHDHRERVAFNNDLMPNVVKAIGVLVKEGLLGDSTVMASNSLVKAYERKKDKELATHLDLECVVDDLRNIIYESHAGQLLDQALAVHEEAKGPRILGAAAYTAVRVARSKEVAQNINCENKALGFICRLKAWFGLGNKGLDKKGYRPLPSDDSLDTPTQLPLGAEGRVHSGYERLQ